MTLRLSLKGSDTTENSTLWSFPKRLKTAADWTWSTLGSVIRTTGLVPFEGPLVSILDLIHDLHYLD